MSSGLVSIPSSMKMYDITESFSQYYVDPSIAQQNVPKKWKVKIYDNGNAMLLVMVQNCKKMVLDHLINVGSVGLSHIWIEVEGLDEVITPLPGTSRSLPTRYWYILPHQIDNRFASVLYGLAGVSCQSVRRVSVGGNPIVTRSGEVIEGESPDEIYTWTETIQLYHAPDIVTGSQRFYRKYGKRESAGHVRCESHFLGESKVDLSATPNTAVGNLGFGTSLAGFSNPVWVKYCDVDYIVSYF